MRCSVLNCKSCSDQPTADKNKISFYSFPSDDNLKIKWIEIINRKDWSPSKYSKVCGLHFNDSDFIDSSRNRYRKLREGACPSLQKQQDRDKTPEPCDLKEFLTFNDTPRKIKLKEEIARLRINERKYKLKIRRIQRNLRRLKKKMTTINLTMNYGETISTCDFVLTTMEMLYTHLQHQNLLNEEETEILSLTDISVRDLIGRHTMKAENKSVPKKYSPGLRMFALTLNYYSPKAYSYVREKFNTCLPHPRTIAKWYENVNGEAGFTAESFEVLKLKSEKSSETLLCSLMMDEMAIRKHLEWDGNKCHGYIDLGLEVSQNHDNSQEATQALVMLLVGLKERWKIPVGFFLFHSMTGEKRASLVQQCLYKTHDSGVEVVSLTMDGCAANIVMAKKLGCCFSPTDLKTTFKHPSSDYDIAVLLDACHMLKLIRNTFEAKSVFIDYQGNEVSWWYLKQLNEYQKAEGLHVANKLKDKHIDYHRQKMKVKLASQLFSNSVADALTVCEKSNSNFHNVQPTIIFIRLMNNLFDVLNSRSMCQHEYKKPLFEKNIVQIKQFLEFSKNYLLHLVVKSESTNVINTNRKTGFVGFLTCIVSTIFLYTRLVETQKKLNYLPTHKLSQDHLELLFGMIRAHGRTNNNPTARQFKAAYKKMLINTELKGSFNGNCIPLEDIPMLNMSSAQKINASADRSRMLQTEHDDDENEDDPIPDDVLLEFDDQLNSFVRNTLRRQIVTYICGYVIKFLLKRLKCESCLNALSADNYTDDHYLIMTKNKGGLIFPSNDVIQICSKAECTIRTFSSDKDNHKSVFDKLKIVSHTMKSLIGQDCFKSLNNHIMEQSPFNNHITLLSKSICEKYVDIRFRHFAMCKNVRATKRQQLNKTVLFTGD